MNPSNSSDRVYKRMLISDMGRILYTLSNLRPILYSQGYNYAMA